MTTGRSTFLVDTNLVIYALDPRDRMKQARSIQVTSRLVAERVGALTAQVLGEFFVNVTRRLPAPLTLVQAEEAVLDLARSWTVFDVTPLAVLEAIRGVRDHHLSYYDALIWAVAKLNGVPYLLSEDFSDGRMIETVRCLNPLAPGFDLNRYLSR